MSMANGKKRLFGPPDRNRTYIPRLGGMCTIHCATGRTRALDCGAALRDLDAVKASSGANLTQL